MRAKIILCLLVVLSLLFYCQKEKSTEPAPDNGSHPQVDIPWPSLADSPWPIAHGDVQCTGRSPLSGPQEGKVEWIFEYEGMRIEIGSPVIGEDGTIYFVDDRRLFAINPNGTLKWKYDPNRLLDTTPMIGAGDIIYFGAGRGSGSMGAIYSMNNDGTIRWHYLTDGAIHSRCGAIGLDGSIYYCDMAGFLYSITKDGALVWKSTGRSGYYGGYNSAVSMSPDGLTLYIHGLDSTINAVDIQTGEIQWYLKTGMVPNFAILVDNDGNLYCAMRENDKQCIFSIEPTGAIRWKYFIEQSDVLDNICDMHMDYQGNIYIFTWAKRVLFSLNYYGNLRWKVEFEPDFEPPGSPIIGDKRGTVFVTSNRDYVIAYDTEGNKIFELKIDPYALGMISGAINRNGKLFVCSRLKLICIK